MYKFKSDNFQRSRGGNSKMLSILCDHCESRVCYYQKDGPGLLKRMYWDRTLDLELTNDSFKCPNCDRLIGVEITYEKEKRTAYRLFAGAVTKRAIKLSELPENVYVQTNRVS